MYALILLSSLISLFCSFTALFKRLTCRFFTFSLCMQSMQLELPCRGDKLEDGVTAESGVALFSVAQLILADPEVAGKVTEVAHARGVPAIVTLVAMKALTGLLSTSTSTSSRCTDFPHLYHQHHLSI